MGNVHEVTAPNNVALLLWRLRGSEEIGRGFEYQVELLYESEEADIDANDMLGKPLAIKVASPDHGDRHFHGLICRFELLRWSRPYYIYRATIRPWFWFLKHTADCRIFQNKTIQDILTDVLKTKNGFSDFRFSLTGTYQTREYCVQYRETDFDFVSRLLEEEGIYYFYEHTASNHTMVLCDAASAHAAIASGTTAIPYKSVGDENNEDERLSTWQSAEEVWTTKYTVRSYNFEQPSANLEARTQISRTHALSSYEFYDYPDNYLVATHGTHYSKVWAESLQARQLLAYGEGSSQRIAAGMKFTLEEHPQASQNAEYLIVSTKIEVQSGEAMGPNAEINNSFQVSLTAIKADKQYRSLRVVPKPVIAGPQTAKVVGKTGEEIWTDQYGRVKVQFPWDRVGQNDESSSCWLRVAQIWAGKNWGGIDIPRIGQEVLVQFMEGDPDRPIVVGRVYNAEQMPPYALPDNATQSGVKTRSSKEGTAENFNELRFEDKKDQEQVYFHAEKNFDRVVENNDTLKVGFEKKDKGDQTIEVFNNRTLKVGAQDCEAGDETTEIWNNRTLKVGTQAQDGKGSQTTEIHQDDTTTIKKGNQTLTIQTGNRDVTVSQGNDSLTIGQGNLTIKLNSGTCSIDAATKIELKVGSSTIVIEPAAITIKSADVKIEGTGTFDAKSPASSVSGDGNLTLKGGVVQIN
jgi:type VI secretion system secreted protein VgrG